VIGLGQGQVFGQATIGSVRRGAPSVGTGAQRNETGAQSVELALVKKYCVGCHNSRLKTGGVILDGLEPSNVVADPAVWEGVVRTLNAGMVPPPGRPRPDAGAGKRFVGPVAATIDGAAAAHPNPGPPISLHRLNRAEYQNAVRDLLAVDVDVRGLLPPD